MGFVHLHNHTEYSILDGAVTVNRLMKKCKDEGHTAVGLTDHGYMFGYVKFQDAAFKNDIKPIVGCEFYLQSRLTPEPGKSPIVHHIVLLAQNRTGLDNLVAMGSLSAKNVQGKGIFARPCLHHQMMEEHKEGVICLSACLNGEVNYLLRKKHTALAEESLIWYKQTFGENFFIELHNHFLEDEDIARPLLIEAANAMNLPLVATNDIHYLEKSEVESHDAKLAIQTGKKMDEVDRFKFHGGEYYFKTETEMRALFPEAPEAIDNTVLIADRVDLQKQKGTTYYFPSFVSDVEGETQDEAFSRLCWEGFKNRYPNPTQEAKDRLEMEMGVITSMGFPGYFLILWDVVKAAKEKDILVGPGRGSAAGSMVAFVLNITDVEPLRYGLLFERFLNPDRKSMPDIDMDFEDSRRGDVFRYVVEKYGENNVAQISTFASMKTKAVLKDVARVLGIAYSKIDRFIKLLPPDILAKIEGDKLPLSSLLELSDEIKSEVDADEELSRMFVLAGPLHNLNRTRSVHAAGVVIGSDELYKKVPLCLAQGDTFTKFTTQVTMEDCEALGLVKMDFLGIRTLTVLKESIRLVNQRTGLKLTIPDIPLDDPKTYKLFQQGKTDGIFQFESDGMRKLLTETRPTNVEQLTALNALFRPGPLQSGMTASYAKLSQGKEKVTYPHPAAEPILNETFGVVVYQEQVMEMAGVLARMTRGQRDDLRKAMGKKNPEKMAEMRSIFVEGAKNNEDLTPPLSGKEAGDIFDLLAAFAGYGFNKSHSVSYAILAAQTAWVKAHYPAEYLAALLNGYMDKRDDLNEYVATLKEDGIELKPPHVNHSGLTFAPEGENAIRYGFVGIKNVGEAASEAILKARKEGGHFKDLPDFLTRVDSTSVNRKTIESLLKCGAFEGLPGEVSQWLAVMEELMHKVTQLKNSLRQTQDSLFGDETPVSLSMPELPPIPPMPFLEKLDNEMELLGLYVSGHPLDEVADALSRVPHTDIGELYKLAKENGLGGEEEQTATIAGMIVSVSRKTSNKGKQFAFMTVEDTTGKLEVPVFGNVFAECDSILKEKALVKIRGRLQFKEAFQATASVGEEEETPLTPQIIADEIVALEIETKPPKALVLEVRPFLDETELKELINKLTREEAEGELILQISLDQKLRRIRLNPEMVRIPLSLESRKLALGTKLCQAAYFE